VTWGGAGACGRGLRDLRAREAEAEFGGPQRFRGSPPSDPTAPHYDGAAEKAGSGSGEDRRVRPARGRKLRQARVRHLRPDRRQERTASTSKSPNVPERSGRGAHGNDPSGESPGEPRGRRKAPIKLDESFGVPRPSTFPAIAIKGRRRPPRGSKAMPLLKAERRRATEPERTPPRGSMTSRRTARTSAGRQTASTEREC
jgi:hypothetical protein